MPVADSAFIIPIVMVKTASSSEHLQQVWMLLERNGTHLIPIEHTEHARIQQFLETNDLVALRDPVKKGNYIFVEIDAEKTDLAAFWSWKEIAPGSVPMKEAWRPFFWSRPGPEPEAQADPWGVNRFLEEIDLAGPLHTAYRVLLTLSMATSSI